SSGVYPKSMLCLPLPRRDWPGSPLAPISSSDAPGHMNWTPSAHVFGGGILAAQMRDVKAVAMLYTILMLATPRRAARMSPDLERIRRALVGPELPDRKPAGKQAPVALVLAGKAADLHVCVIRLAHPP